MGVIINVSTIIVLESSICNAKLRFFMNFHNSEGCMAYSVKFGKNSVHTEYLEKLFLFC